MSLFVRFTAWADFSAGQLALADVDERMIDGTFRKAESIALLRSMPSSEALRKREETMTAVKATVANDPDVIRLREELDVIYARRKLLQAIAERADRDAALLSRELTRRVGGQDAKQRRATRYGT